MAPLDVRYDLLMSPRAQRDELHLFGQLRSEGATSVILPVADMDDDEDEELDPETDTDTNTVKPIGRVVRADDFAVAERKALLRRLVALDQPLRPRLKRIPVVPTVPSPPQPAAPSWPWGANLEKPPNVQPAQQALAAREAADSLAHGQFPKALWPLTRDASRAFVGSVARRIEFGLQLDVSRIFYEYTLRLHQPQQKGCSEAIQYSKLLFGRGESLWRDVAEELAGTSLRSPAAGRLHAQRLQSLIGIIEEAHLPQMPARPSTPASATLPPPANFVSLFERSQVAWVDPSEAVRCALPQKAAQILFEWAVKAKEWPIANRAMRAYLHVTKLGPSPFDTQPLSQSTAVMTWAKTAPAHTLVAFDAWQQHRHFVVESPDVRIYTRSWPAQELVPMLLVRFLPRQPRTQHERPELMAWHASARLLADAAARGAGLGPHLYGLLEGAWSPPAKSAPGQARGPGALDKHALRALACALLHPQQAGPLYFDGETRSARAMLEGPLERWLLAYEIDAEALLLPDGGGASARASQRLLALCSYCALSGATSRLEDVVSNFPVACADPTLNEAIVRGFLLLGRQIEACRAFSGRSAPYAEEHGTSVVQDLLQWASQRCRPWPSDPVDEDDPPFNVPTFEKRGQPLFQLLDTLHAQRAAGAFYSRLNALPPSVVSHWQNLRRTPNPRARVARSL